MNSVGNIGCSLKDDDADAVSPSGEIFVSVVVLKVTFERRSRMVIIEMNEFIIFNNKLRKEVFDERKVIN